jgi:hypothetical protein
MYVRATKGIKESEQDSWEQVDSYESAVKDILDTKILQTTGTGLSRHKLYWRARKTIKNAG